MIEELEVAKQVVARKVAEYLKNRRPGGMTLEVDPQRIRKREHEWQVVVRPSEEPPKLSESYEALADVETALEACEQLKVFLVPGEPKHLPSGEDEDDATRPSSTPERRRRWTKLAVAKKVAEYLRDCHPGGMTLEVDPQRIRKQGSEWQVVVHPSEEPSKLLEYYEALADVEMALDEREHLNVWLVTGDPEHSRAADAQPQAVPAP